MNAKINTELVQQIKTLLESSRQKIAIEVNTTLIYTYWQIGKIIVEDENMRIGDTEYEKYSLRQLSKVLTNEFGKGFSRSNLSNMCQLYLTHNRVQTVSGQLSWSHYCELLTISDQQKRNFYEKECINAHWSVRELRRQIKSSLFERLLLSNDEASKEKVISMAMKGNDIAKPADIIRDPYVFEFLGLPEDKPFLESDLEKALVEQIEKFLLELGRGFMFVGTQQRITLGNHHYYVDMVFNNKYYILMFLLN